MDGGRRDEESEVRESYGELGAAAAAAAGSRSNEERGKQTVDHGAKG
jgi:hypothetical protein